MSVLAGSPTSRGRIIAVLIPTKAFTVGSRPVKMLPTFFGKNLSPHVASIAELLNVDRSFWAAVVVSASDRSFIVCWVEYYSFGRITGIDGAVLVDDRISATRCYGFNIHELVQGEGLLADDERSEGEGSRRHGWYTDRPINAYFFLTTTRTMQ